MSVEEIKKNNICAFENCNKKLKITDYPCKCGIIYCKFHRDPLIHNCSYDYKENTLKQNQPGDRALHHPLWAPSQTM